jgi:eukaryotic-like serine/threonine-protein kinase
MTLGPGTRIGAYEILASLGAGGMGEVYRARDTRLNRDVAIKILPDRLASDAERVARFTREAQTLAGLNHPHIAQIYGFEEGPADAGPHTRALVMELVEGEDLLDRLRRGPVPLEEAVEIARQIAEGLETAHDQGIVHRDLKPANVKVRPDGTVKILDFGLAKALQATAPISDARAASPLPEAATITSPALMTAHGMILGTAAYMAPEQARGKAVDKRADIWGFGVILYEMLAGRWPFDGPDGSRTALASPDDEGDTVTDVLAAMLSREPQWQHLPDSTPAALRQLLHRCLEKDVRQRLRDIGEARVMLARLGAKDDEPAPVPPRLSVAPRRAAVWLPWAVAAVAILTAVGVWALRPDPVAPLRKLELSLPSNGNFALSPDGTRLGGRVADRIVIVDLVRLQQHELAASRSITRNVVFWSPDSAFLGYNDADGRLWIVPAEGGTPRLVCIIPETRQLMGAAWRRDGSIVFAAWRGNLYSVPATGGQPSLLVEIDPSTEIDFHNPVELPDGRLLVAAHLVSDSPGAYRIERLDGSRRERALEGAVDIQPLGYDDGHVLLARGDVNRGVWAIPYTGKLPMQMSDGVVVAPDAELATSSANAHTLLYTTRSTVAEPRELVWVDRGGRVVDQAGPSRIDLFAPALSPDGTRVAYSALTGEHHSIWVRDLKTYLDTRVTSDPGDRTYPRWLPSARRLVYSELVALAMERLAASEANGSGDRRELSEGLHPVIAPDGRHLAFLVDERGAWRARVASLEPDGTVGPARPLLNLQPEPRIHGLSFSRDGSLLAYVEQHPGGAVDVFLTSFPSGEGRWQISNGGGRAPVWSRDELFFIAGSNDGPKQMMAAPVAAGSTPVIGTPGPLFAMGDDLYAPPQLNARMSGFGAGRYDVTPDGTRFLMVRSPAGTSSERRWILVQNWRSEFATSR